MKLVYQNVRTWKLDRFFCFVLLVLSINLLTACRSLSPLVDFIAEPNIKESSWVRIPAGTFVMGEKQGDDDEEPVHNVFLNEYWISGYEITNEQYQMCVAAGACSCMLNQPADQAQHPVVRLTWNEANEFCVWIGGRLPSEAEWEKAARGGLVGALYPWGDDEVSCDQNAKNGAQFGYCSGELLTVGSFPPNGYGVYDMAGNAWEWVADWYDKDYYRNSSETNPTGPADGKYKVIRGGGWNYTVYGLRVAYRSVSYPDSKANFIGFRCVRELSSQ